MGKVFYLEDFFGGRDKKRLKVYFDYGEYSNPTRLLADFFQEYNIIPSGSCSRDFGFAGSYMAVFENMDDVGNFTYADFTYDDGNFEVGEFPLRNGRVFDLFTKFLSENEIPFKKLK